MAQATCASTFVDLMGYGIHVPVGWLVGAVLWVVIWVRFGKRLSRGVQPLFFLGLVIVPFSTAAAAQGVAMVTALGLVRLEGSALARGGDHTRAAELYDLLNQESGDVVGTEREPSITQEWAAREWLLAAQAKPHSTQVPALANVVTRYENTRAADEARELVLTCARTAENRQEWQSAAAAYEVLLKDNNVAAGGLRHDRPEQAKAAYGRCTTEAALREGRQGRYRGAVEMWFAAMAKLPGLTPLPAAYYYQAGRQYEESGRLEEAKHCYTFFSQTFPKDRQVPAARTHLVDVEVALIAGGKHGDLPAPERHGGGSRVSYTIKNDTGQTLFVLFSGPTSQKITLAAGESTVVHMPNGTYREAAHVSDSSVIPFYAERDLNGSLSQSLYIETRTTPGY